MYYAIQASGCLTVLIALLGLGGQAFSDEPASDKIIELGISKNLFRGASPVLHKSATSPFLKLLKDQTGRDSKLNVFANPITLALQMNEGKIELGVFQGHEFAWAQAEYPSLVPLVVATPLEPIQSFCLVRWDCKAKNIGELKGKKISFSQAHADCCTLFLAHQKEEYMKGTTFGEEMDEPKAIDAMFDVIDGKSAGAIVDRTLLKYFEATYPGPYKNLKILSHSEEFPNPCIAVKKNKLTKEETDKLCSTLINAKSQSGGESLLTLWKLKSFDKVPSDYEASLKRIQKKYPPPAVTRSVER